MSATRQRPTIEGFGLLALAAFLLAMFAVQSCVRVDRVQVPARAIAQPPMQSAQFECHERRQGGFLVRVDSSVRPIGMDTIGTAEFSERVCLRPGADSVRRSAKPSSWSPRA